jgi:hypothetical protein
MSSDDDPTVPIVCPDCDTTTRVPLPNVADAVARHNENVHGGEEVAAVDPAVTDRLADLVAEDMGLLDED